MPFSSVRRLSWQLTSALTPLIYVGIIQFINCTAAMAGNFSRSFCVTATRTVITLAAGPVIRTLTIGPEISTSSKPPPPVPAERGRCQVQVYSKPGRQPLQPHRALKRSDMQGTGRAPKCCAQRDWDELSDMAVQRDQSVGRQKLSRQFAKTGLWTTAKLSVGRAASFDTALFPL